GAELCPGGDGAGRAIMGLRFISTWSPTTLLTSKPRLPCGPGTGCTSPEVIAYEHHAGLPRTDRRRRILRHRYRDQARQGGALRLPDRRKRPWAGAAPGQGSATP